MQSERAYSIIIIAIAIIYTVVMFNFLMNLENHSLAKQQLNSQLNSEVMKVENQRQVGNNYRQ